MRYITKEVYRLMQTSTLYMYLKVDERAKEKSEALYQEIYLEKENWFIELRRKWYNTPPVFTFLGSKEEYGETEFYKDAERKLQEEQITFDSRPPFDEEKEKAVFAHAYSRPKNKYQIALPKKVLSHIADQRVLALDVVTQENYDLIKKYCEQCLAKMEAAFASYHKYYREKHVPERILDKCGFHDCRILECIIGKDITIKFDIDGGFTSTTSIIFKNGKILEQEGPLEKRNWLYEEIYFDGNTYEFHALLLGGPKGTSYLTIACDDIQFP